MPKSESKKKFIHPVDGFPHDAEKYICRKGCCCKPHCTIAAKRVAYFTIFLKFLYFCKAFHDFHDLNGTFIATLVTIFVELGIIIAFFIGIKRYNKRLVLPFVALQMVMLVAYGFILLCLIIAIITPQSFLADNLKGYYEPYMEKPITDSRLRGAFFGSILVFIVLEIMFVWFFDITKRCYNYLRDFENYRKEHGTAVEVDRRGVPIQSDVPLGSDIPEI